MEEAEKPVSSVWARWRCEGGARGGESEGRGVRTDGRPRRAVPVLLGTLTPAPEPVIIHGDLWSGNYGVEEHTSQARIFDPASYWGHNEAELGMTHMFGGGSVLFRMAWTQWMGQADRPRVHQGLLRRVPRDSSP